MEMSVNAGEDGKFKATYSSSVQSKVVVCLFQKGIGMQTGVFYCSYIS